jgi:type III secretion system FlhB-like substrate exporter
MGADLLALKIREVAGKSRVPVLEAPPLARALYKHGEVGKEVPVALYTAVAQVLAWVYGLRNARRAPAEPVIEVPQRPRSARGAPLHERRHHRTVAGKPGVLSCPAGARALGAPLLIVVVLAMMLVPLPPFALDLLFSFNIASPWWC